MLPLAPFPKGFTVSDFASHVRALSGQNEQEYGVRRAAYDLKKIRGKGLVARVASCRRYQPLSQGLQAIAALLVLRDKVIRPLLAGVATPRLGRRPKNWSRIDQHYETLRLNMRDLFKELRIAA